MHTTPTAGGPRRGTTPSVARRVASVLVVGIALLAAACSSGGSSTGTTATTLATGPAAPPAVDRATGLPPIRHVFVIVLENQTYSQTFGDPTADPYLATTLPASGALLSQYHGIGHHSNDNYIALVSGQAPNPSNQADCPVFADFPATATVATDGQISDSGCVFPTSVHTVADQLDAAHLTWKGYMQDMGAVPAREPAVCAHPAVGRRTPPSWPSPATATPPATTRSSTSTRSSTTRRCATPGWSRWARRRAPSRRPPRPARPASPPT